MKARVEFNGIHVEIVGEPHELCELLTSLASSPMAEPKEEPVLEVVDENTLNWQLILGGSPREFVARRTNEGAGKADILVEMMQKARESGYTTIPETALRNRTYQKLYALTAEVKGRGWKA